jgi:ABC-type polysaccharide/polyol phosphate transport system ATPase subunit
MAHIHLERVDLAPPGCSLVTRFSPGRLFRAWRSVARPGVLHEVSLTIRDGERVALVGPDGAGKSALLALLVGLHHPSAGAMMVEGSVVRLADVSQQVDREATGWENIERRLGPGTEARRLGAFTDLGEFLDLPARVYSAGMLWRLGFSLATACAAEVLLLDGVCGGGDLAFRGRAEQRLRQLIDRSRITVAAGHDLETLARGCSRAVWLEAGRVRDSGPLDKVLAAYREGQPVAA